jgi:hypothetical protein
MLDIPEHSLEQGAFAGAVRADDCRQLPAVNVDIHIIQNFCAAYRYAKVFNLCAAQPGAMLAKIILFVLHFNPPYRLSECINWLLFQRSCHRKVTEDFKSPVGLPSATLFGKEGFN